MGKHAYLIMAHKNDYTFHTLLKLLDDERNAIFIHMDKKNTVYQESDTKKIIQHADLYHTERLDIRWGGFSQIKGELLLMETASNTGYYDYYHYISGEDLPIKTQDEIHQFFDANQGKEFVQFFSDSFEHDYRIRYYHTFQEFVGRKENMLMYMNDIYLKIQEIVGIHRSKNVIFRKGTSFFSITDELVHYILSQKKWIYKTFHSTHCGDEIFLQTVVHNSSFKDRLYHPEYDNDYDSIARYIRWGGIDDNTPHVWRIDDKEDLKTSNYMFARKFICTLDKDIIDYVASELASK